MNRRNVIGVCIGASNVKLISGCIDHGRFLPLKQVIKAHEGNARLVLEALLAEHVLPGDLVAVTGRKLKEQVLLPALAEPEATEAAYWFLRDKTPPVEAIVSAGGETFMVYELDKAGRIAAVHTGNKCASGTGEFFLQQVRRMDLAPEDALSLADLEQPYKVAGRCSVFTKSDCTHALNKGVPKGRVVAGLCRMMAAKIAELLAKTGAKGVMVIGGTAQNRAMIEYLRREGYEVILPQYAELFEALGAAVWAAVNSEPWSGGSLFKPNVSSFKFLEPLSTHQHRVSFKEQPWGQAAPVGEYIIGLDVGSTTTKAVLVDVKERVIVAGTYLRTNGDPVAASRQCYRELAEQVPAGIRIIGLGVTGSGRQIAGLHALTRGIVNEIVAHTTAAVYWDAEVDTIFEIGGQDAKYTYINNGVPSDYAMNEACSAGTGSFLEEAARESLDMATEEICFHALQGVKPPNFNDQCAAFISSDVKTAIQEGLAGDDIAAGLVYSICLNYINRVKGSRPVGRKIFMQGGVCYNRAVPVAMAAITGREIIVPPDPGLMGAFGVALEVLRKLEEGLLSRSSYDLAELAARPVEYGQPFVCGGGREKCDRKCTIARIKIAGKSYPFGGACNKYYNERMQLNHDGSALDLVVRRQRLLFDRPTIPAKPNGLRVGISSSLMTNNLYPFYHAFFTTLGFEIVLADEPDADGLERRGAAFCHPVDLAHGFMLNLIRKKPDYIFLPHVQGLPVVNGIHATATCPFVQAEPYILNTAFQEDLKGIKVLAPVLAMLNSYEDCEKDMVKLGLRLGAGRRAAKEAFAAAVFAQKEFNRELKRLGTEALVELEQGNHSLGVVLFGRSYNAFASVANMGIPHKFATRGVMIIPHDMLDLEQEEPIPKMYWSTGMGILKAAKLVKAHPKLFGAYITSFSCGPDSFVINYFREIMGEKPSLTLELDAHTADAGVDTRVEAFLDVAGSYLTKARRPLQDKQDFQPAVMVQEGESWFVRLGLGEHLKLTDPRVKLIIPSMGDYASRLIAAAFRYCGIRAEALPAPADAELQWGKNHATCKECLPLMLTVGSLLRYLDRREPGEVTVYFMPETDGPCRFGQYNVLISMLINKLQLPNVAMLSLTSENGYAGLGNKFTQRAFIASVVADVMEEIRAAVLTLSRQKDYGLRIYSDAEKIIEEAIATTEWDQLVKVLQIAAHLLARIPLHKPLAEAVKVALIGEIYVRRDGFSRRYLVEQLAEKGLVALTAPVTEWIYYSDYCAAHGLSTQSTTTLKLKTKLKSLFMVHYEKNVKQALAASGLYEYHLIDVEHLMQIGSHYINPKLTGETILTLASALAEIIDKVDGVVAIGPFGCMPSRIAEAMINQTINRDKLGITQNQELIKKVIAEHPRLPFLSIESDGNPFPPVIEARLESFVLQAKRLHHTMVETSKTSSELAYDIS
ncbi:MAG: acyl-CoA dehydratase activase [Bacillota bacterium]